MGYFANGTEGQIYEEQYCNHCVHGDGECPIMELHMAWNYDAVGENADKTKAAALEVFIPRDEEKCCNKECRMFVRREIGIGGQQ